MAKKKIRRFAEGTSVDVSKSRLEVESLLSRHDADQILVGTDQKKGTGFVAFTLEKRQVRLFVPPRETGKRNRDQIERERWRALVLLLKGKLEIIASGMATFEQEFLAYIVLPNGKTVGEELTPRLASAYENNEMPKLLPEGM